MYDGLIGHLIFFFMFYVCRGIQLPFRRPDFQEAIFLLSHHHLHTWMHVGHRFLGQVSKTCTVWQYTQYGPIKNGRIKNQHSDFEKK